MRIDRNFNVVFAIDGVKFHARPIPYAFFEDNADVFSEIESSLIGVPIELQTTYAYPVLKKAAKNDAPMLTKFLNELRRGVSVIIDGESDMLDTAIERGELEPSVVSEAYGTLIFFTLVSWARTQRLNRIDKDNPNEAMRKLLAVAGLEQSSLGIMEYTHSLATSTKAENQQATV